MLGLILGIVGVALGSQLTVDGELLKAHKGIGIAAVVAVALQTVLAVSWRPPPKSTKRCAANACVMARPTLLPCCYGATRCLCHAWPAMLCLLNCSTRTQHLHTGCSSGRMRTGGSTRATTGGLGRVAACLAIANVFLGLQSQSPDLTHYIIAYAVVIGVLFLIWLAAALIKWRFEPVFIPSKRYPDGKNADYEGTELAPAQQSGRH